MSSISFQPIFGAALADYSKQVGIDLATHPLSDSLQSCGSPDDVLQLLEDKANEFKEFRDGNRKLLNWLRPVVQVVHTLSAVLGASVTLVSPENPHFFICFFSFNSITRFRSNQPRRFLLVWMFSSQYASRIPLNSPPASPHHIWITCCRQPVASARAMMRSSTCLNVSGIFSNVFGSIAIS